MYIVFADLCQMDDRMKVVIPECNIMYTMGKQEERTFDIGWELQTSNTSVNTSADWYRSVFVGQVTDSHEYILTRMPH